MKVCLSIAFVLAALLLPAETVRACSCPSDSPAPVDRGFRYARDIAIFKLLRRERDPDAKGYEAKVERPVFSVQKVYKGDLTPGRTMVFAEGDCDLGFDGYPPGTEFLFYLGSRSVDEKYWRVSFCTRSGTVGRSAGDLMYIENIDNLRGKTRLSGDVWQAFEGAIEGDRLGLEMLKGWPVVISGNGKAFHLMTDNYGVYEIYDLEPGRYRITSPEIRGYDFYKANDLPYIEVDIEGTWHTEQNIAYTIKNAVRGRLFDAKGSPLWNVELELVPTKGEVLKRFYGKTRTDKDGYFEFRSRAAGRYLIFVHDMVPETNQSLPSGFFYPGTLLREKASPITIEAGQVIKDLIITTPKTRSRPDERAQPPVPPLSKRSNK